MLELLKRFGGPYRRYLTIGPASKLIEVVFDLLTPLVVAAMIDRAVAARNVGGVLGGAGTLALMALAGFASTLICQKMASRASQGLGTSLRDALFTRVNELPCAELDHFGTPSLITRITSDVNQVQLAVALGIRQLTRFPLLAVGSMIAALLIDAKLGLIFLVATPVIGIVFWVVMAACVPLFKRLQSQLDRLSLLVREGLGGVRVVRAFVREEDERERFARAATSQAQTAVRTGALSSVLNPATFLIMNLAVCAILWTGGVSVQVGALTQGQVVAFVNYMTQTLLAIVYVANLVVVFIRASASAARILEVLDCDPQGESQQAGDGAVSHAQEGLTPACGQEVGSASAQEGAGSGRTPSIHAVGVTRPHDRLGLRLRDVRFTYPGAASSAVRGVSLELPQGAALGIIGGTGAGKSTLASLLLRLYDVDTGVVEVGGVDVRAWPLKELRHAVSIVPQRAQLLSGTIRSNLQWRDARAGDDELWRALETAQAAAFVRALPDGLDTRVEAGGRNFSGGQRQRLTIARALVARPSVLVLDDAASALDFKTDAALRSALRREAARGAAPGASCGAACDGELGVSCGAAQGVMPSAARCTVFGGARDATRGAMPEAAWVASGGAMSEAARWTALDSAPLTTVTVSQRVSAVRDADVICVLHHGEMSGLGTHEELVASCELYREICRSQGIAVPAGAHVAASAGESAAASVVPAAVIPAGEHVAAPDGENVAAPAAVPAAAPAGENIPAHNREEVGRHA